MPADAEPKAMGRPSLYSEDMAQRICIRLMEGESLRSICRDDSMPGKSTVMDWLDANEAFRTKYARARELQADELFDEMLEIADDRSNDIRIRKRDGEDIEEVDHEHIQRAKLRVETRKWQASKLAPKKYGDKLALDHGGQVGIGITISSDDAAL